MKRSCGKGEVGGELGERSCGGSLGSESSPWTCTFLKHMNVFIQNITHLKNVKDTKWGILMEPWMYLLYQSH